MELIAILIIGGAIVGAIVLKKINSHEKKESAKADLLEELNLLADDLVERHAITLATKFNQSLVTDDYGRLDKSIWLKHVRNFVFDVFAEEAGAVIRKSRYRELATNDELLRLFDFITAGEFGLQVGRRAHDVARSFDVGFDFDEDMTPLDFELACRDALRSVGWDAEQVGRAGDQGADVIAHKDVNGVKRKLVVQCKLYTQPVGNAAVQEAFSAKKYHSADYACVATNTSYTRSAKSLAATTGVVLLHYNDIKEIDEHVLSCTKH